MGGTTGSKIPVLESEMLMIKTGGRGLYMYSGGTTTNCANVSNWNAYFPKASSQSNGTIDKKFLPAASAQAWFKIDLDGTTYYVPGFTDMGGI